MHTVSKSEKKMVKALSVKKYRQQEKMFVVEGVKPVNELLEHAPSKVFKIFTVDREKLNVPIDEEKVFVVSEKDLKSLSNLKNPQGVIALAEFIEKPLVNMGLTLVLDNIQDPGNLGTIIRSAEWFGVTEVVCSNSTVDKFNPKVVQAAMGALFRVVVNYVDLEEYLKSTKRPIYGALLEGENLYESTLNKEAVLVMGNEGNGISEEIKSYLTHPVTIPKLGEGESLNVSIATAVLLSEFARQISL